MMVTRYSKQAYEEGKGSNMAGMHDKRKPVTLEKRDIMLK